MGKVIFILGGVKSGKTQYVINQAKRKNPSVTYLATATAGDKEMKAKIEEHKKMRPKNWQTIEEPYDLLNGIRKITSKVIIVDCINFWLANIIPKGEKEIIQQVNLFCHYLKNKNYLAYIVSNEVSMSLIPINKLGRKFQELLSKVNQIITQYADKVYLMVAGIPVRVK